MGNSPYSIGEIVAGFILIVGGAFAIGWTSIL